MDEYYTWDFCSVCHKHWPEFMYVGMLPIFHGPVILPYILKTVWWINVVLEILIQCDTNIDLNYICRSVTLFHGLVILPYILKTVWWTNVIIGILDSYDANIYHIKCMWVSDLSFMVQWFCHILKTFWWRNVVLKILNQCNIKFDLQIYM